MHKRLAQQIRGEINSLIDRYDSRLRVIPGYAELPEPARHSLERRVLDLIADCLETNNDQLLIDYIHERARQVLASGADLEWFQQAVAVLEEIVIPLVTTVAESNFAWRTLNRAQETTWHFIAEERQRLEHEFQESLEQRNRQVQTSTEVAQHIAAAPELEELFHRVVTLIKERFNYYHVQLFRYVPAEDTVKLITGYGEVGQKMLAAGHKLAMGRGVVGTAAATGQSILAADVARDLDWRPNPNLPNTKCELAIPIKLGGSDAESQLNALRYFVNGSYDGIAITAIDPQAVARITHESLQRGKPVVTISSDLGQDNQSSLVFAVEHELGYLLGVQAGAWAKQHLPDDQNVKLGMLNYRTLPQVIQREKGIVDGIQSVIGERVTIVVSGSAVEAKEAAYLTEGWLRDHPDLNMIVAINDADALGAYRAAQVMGRQDADQFFIGGIDAVPEALAAIQQGGVYQATVNQPPEIMGIMAVRTLVAAIKGIPVKPIQTLYCAPVNRSNVAKFSGPAREVASFANQDIIPAETLSGLDVSGLRLGLSVLTLANPFFAALVASAQQEAQRLGVQLVINDPSRVLGVLDVQSDQVGKLGAEDRLLLEGLCGQIAIAIESRQAEEALRSAHAELAQAMDNVLQFKSAFEHTNVGMAIVTTEGRFMSVNQALCDLVGYTREELEHKRFGELTHPDDVSSSLDYLRRALAGEIDAFRAEKRYLHKNGEVIWIELSTSVLRDADRQPLYFISQIQDIRQRKQAEEAIRANDAQLSEALQIAKLADWEYDVEKDLFLFNDQFYSIFHTTAEQAGGYQLSSAQYAQKFVHPDDLAVVGPEIEKALTSTERHYSRWLEHRILYADGGIGRVSVNVNVDRDEQGRILRYYGANQDITERKQAEAKLQELLNSVQQSEQLMRTVIDSTPDWIFIKDQEHRYRLVNQGYATALHMRPGDFIGKNDLDLGFPEELVKGNPDQGIRGFWADDQLVMNSGETQVYANDPATIDGVVHIFNTIKTPLRDADGKIWGVLAFSRDITERERLMAEQQKRTIQLQTAAEVSRASSSILNLEELLPQVVDLVRDRFNFYYVGIFLTDDLQQWAILRAGTGEAGQQMLVNGHKLRIGGMSMISQCIVSQQARIALDVGEEAVRFDNPLLPLTRSEMALPLISRGRVIGAATIQSDQPRAFSQDDVTVLQSMADQISNAVENARLYEQTRAALAEVDTINRRLTGEVWESYLHRQLGEDVIFVTDDSQAAPKVMLQVTDQLSAGAVTLEPDQERQGEAIATAPILLRGQPIGALRVRTPVDDWDKDLQAVLTDMAGHIAQAVENARLVEQTQRTASRERTINEINARVRQTVDLDTILQTAVDQLGQTLRAARVVARIGAAISEGNPVASGYGRGEKNG